MGLKLIVGFALHKQLALVQHAQHSSTHADVPFQPLHVFGIQDSTLALFGGHPALHAPCAVHSQSVRSRSLQPQVIVLHIIAEEPGSMMEHMRRSR